jgi:ABC-type phosphate transport system substrate-binding protein
MAAIRGNSNERATDCSRRMGRRAALLLLGLAPLAWSRPASAQQRTFHVIVHADNPASEVSRQFLADAFLKKTTQWPGGQVIEPVDLKPSSAIRARFSDAVLKRSVTAVKHYWQQIIFSGRGIPPPEVESDDAVVDYILRHRGGVGYVSPAAAIKNAKVIGIRD